MQKNKTSEVFEQTVKKLEREALQHKEGEGVLKESKQHFKKMVLLSPFPISIIDSEGRYLYVNKRFTEVFGYRIEDIPTGRDWFHKAYPDREYRQKVIAAWKSDLENFKKHEVRAREFRVTCKDGTVRDIIFRPVTVSSGKQFVTYEDITEHKVAAEELRKHRDELKELVDERTTELIKANEQLQHEITEGKRVMGALAESEEKYSTLVENSLTGIYIDQDGKIVFANNKFAEIYKYPKDDLIGIESWKLVHPEDRALTDEIRIKRLRGEEAPSEYDARGLRKDGETIWITRRNTRIEYRGQPAVLGNVAEITEHKRAEEEVRETVRRQEIAYDQSIAYARQLKEEIADRKRAEEAVRERDATLSGVVSSITQCMSMIDNKYNILWTNTVAQVVFGPDLVGKKCYLAYRRHLEPCEDCPASKSFADGQVHECETVLVAQDGKPKTFWCTSSVAAWHGQGRPKLVVLVGRDITVRKVTEQKLRESEARLQLILQTIPSGLFTVDLDRRITYWNKQAEAITGLKAEDAIGEDCLEALDCEECKQGCSLLDNRVVNPIYEKECTIHVDGRDITISKNADILRDSEGNTVGCLESFIDITERKLTEEKLITYHEKLQSLASKLSLAEERQRRQVAIEVHDRISQNLAFVKLKLGALRESTSFSSLAGSIDEVLKLVDETIQNTRSLISELGSPILYELGFVPAVEWLTQQVQRQQGIVVEFEDDGQPKPLSEDVRVLLFQAARELLINIAKHAKARTAKVSITRNRNQVRVDVEDDGTGFDIAEIGPSVDTTGRFGLFSIRVRLEPLGGHMEIDSKTGHGTRVTLVAPLKHNRGNKKENVS